MNSPFVKSEIARGLLSLVPPLIHESLLDDKEFRDEFGIIGDSLLVFDESGPSIQRSNLYGAIRQALSGQSEVTVSDTDGREWKLIIDGEENRFLVLAIYHDKQVIKLSHVVLSPDKHTRLRFLELAGRDVNLPHEALSAWRKVLRERAPDDEEADRIYDDLSDTPMQKANLIRHELTRGTLTVSSLVPRSMRYYERLIGTYDGSTSLKDYASGEGRQFFGQLASWQPSSGFLFSLFLSSHSALTAEIRVEQLAREELVRAFDLVEKMGDRISQLGAIEVGLRVLPEVPEIEPFIVRLIEQIRDENVNGAQSNFRLLSTLFVLVDGELSRTRLFSELPPFYRRLASLSQSALISRQYFELGVNIDTFCEWVIEECGMNFIHFHLQSLVDMRLEPRWIPEFTSPSRMRADFLGRIISTALGCAESLRGTELYDLILGTESDSLQSSIKFPYMLSVGPLEGGDSVADTSSLSLLEEIKAQFREEGIESPPLFSLIYLGPLLPKGSVLSELAADALKRNNHRLDGIYDKSQCLTLQTGLASVSAVTRSLLLADELRILVHQYRRDTQQTISTGEAVRVCLAAAASRSDHKEWREYVGGFLTELAFSELEDSDRNALHVQLQYLCHVDPGLWAYCSRADAALKSLRGY